MVGSRPCPRLVAVLALVVVAACAASPATSQIVGGRKADPPKPATPPPQPQPQQQQLPADSAPPPGAAAAADPSQSPSTQPSFDRPGMVLLLRRPTRFTEDRLSIAMRRVTGEKFGISPRSGPNFILPSERYVGAWVIVYGDLAFELFANDMLPTDRRPWPGPEEGADPLGRWAYRAATGEVRLAWANPDGDAARGARAARLIGAVLAELMTDECIGVMLFGGESIQIAPRSGVTARELRSPEPTLATATDPDRARAGAADADPAVKEAVEMARAAWPNFADAFAAKEPGDLFVAWAPLPGGRTAMRLRVESIDPATGKLLGRDDAGRRAEASADQVVDWAMCRGGRIEGNFSGTALRAARVEQRERGDR